MSYFSVVYEATVVNSLPPCLPSKFHYYPRYYILPNVKTYINVPYDCLIVLPIDAKYYVAAVNEYIDAKYYVPAVNDKWSK